MHSIIIRTLLFLSLTLTFLPVPTHSNCNGNRGGRFGTYTNDLVDTYTDGDPFTTLAEEVAFAEEESALGARTLLNAEEQAAAAFGGFNGNAGIFNGRFANGQFGNGRFLNGQFGNGQFGNGRFGNGWFNQCRQPCMPCVPMVPCMPVCPRPGPFFPGRNRSGNNEYSRELIAFLNGRTFTGSAHLISRSFTKLACSNVRRSTYVAALPIPLMPNQTRLAQNVLCQRGYCIRVHAQGTGRSVVVRAKEVLDTYSYDIALDGESFTYLTSLLGQQSVQVSYRLVECPLGFDY